MLVQHFVYQAFHGSHAVKLVVRTQLLALVLLFSAPVHAQSAPQRKSITEATAPVQL